MREINVGLVGFGFGGRVFHAPIIASVEGLKLKKVVERSTANSKVLYPDIEVVPDISDLINDKSIELIAIAVPNVAHYEMALKAIRAGKNVVVEKPFTVTSDEAIALARAAEEEDVVLSVHHNRRFDADFLTIQKLHDSGKFGRVVNYEAHYDRFRPFIKPNSWKEEDTPGAGLVYDLGSHLIDQTLVLFGKPDYVTGFISAERENSKTADHFEIRLEYSDKSAVLKAGMMVRDNSLRYIINGTAGSFIKHGIDVQEEKLKNGKFPKDDANWGLEPQEIWGRYFFEQAGVTMSEKVESSRGDYRLYYQDIYHAITGHKEPYVTAQDGAAVIKIIELAIKSSKEKKSMKFEI